MNTYGDGVTVVHAALVTGYGGQLVRDWDNATQTAVSAAVQPSTTREYTSGQEVVVSALRVHVPPGTSVEAVDRVVWGGDTYWIDGAPELHFMQGTSDHVEFTMRLVEEPAA